MADPFRRSSSPASGIGRALRSKRVNLFEKLEDLLASSTGVRGVEVEVVRSLCRDTGVDLERKFKSDRMHLYRRYLAHCLEDRAISGDESADLEHLRSLLCLPAEDAANAQDEVAREVYGRAIQEVLADLDLDPEEAEFLRRLRGELELSEKVAEQLYAEGHWRARNLAFSAASSGDRVHGTPAGEFTGRSDTNLEDAVSDALTKASVAIPALHWFEVTRISGYVAQGRPGTWHVKLRAGIEPDK